MANITAALYEEFASAHAYPGVSATAIEALDDRRRRHADALADPLAAVGGAVALGALFSEPPLRFQDIAAGAPSMSDEVWRWQWTGIAVLDPTQVEDVLGSAMRSDAEPSPNAWELWPLSDGQTLLLPAGGDEPTVAVTTLLRHPREDLIQLRSTVVVAVGLLDPEDPMAGTYLELQPGDESSQACTRNLRVDDTGAPYKGVCVDEGCTSGCSPLVHIDRDTGVHTLDGCNCRHEDGGGL